MGKLVIAGLGLNGMIDMPRGIISAAEECDTIILEGYTSIPMGMKVDELEGILGKKITLASREMVESDEILNLVRDGNVLFLCAGDPLVATTHQELRISALKAGIEVKYIPAPSIYTVAPSLLGLWHYKFGRTATIQRPYGEYFATSPFEFIVANYKRGLHSLVLLDIDTSCGYFMSPNEAMELMLRAEKILHSGVFTDELFLCVISRAGRDDMALSCGLLGELIKKDFGPPLHTIIIPGELNFMESEALSVLCGRKI